MFDPAAAPPLALRCVHCDGAIVAPTDGLYALLPPAPPHAGYHEVRAVHRRCAADYEEAHGFTIHWLPLTRLWPHSAAAAP